MKKELISVVRGFSLLIEPVQSCYLPHPHGTSLFFAFLCNWQNHTALASFGQVSDEMNDAVNLTLI